MYTTEGHPLGTTPGKPGGKLWCPVGEHNRGRGSIRAHTVFRENWLTNTVEEHTLRVSAGEKPAPHGDERIYTPRETFSRVGAPRNHQEFHKVGESHPRSCERTTIRRNRVCIQHPFLVWRVIWGHQQLHAGWSALKQAGPPKKNTGGGGISKPGL